MSKNSLITLILSYRQILFSEIKKSSIILSFDPLAFELKLFYWYVTVCQWLTTVHSWLTAGLWMRTNALSPAGCWSMWATSFSNATLSVSTLTDTQWRTYYCRSCNTTKEVWDPHCWICRGMRKWSLQLFCEFSVIFPEWKMINMNKMQFL